MGESFRWAAMGVFVHPAEDKLGLIRRRNTVGKENAALGDGDIVGESDKVSFCPAAVDLEWA